MHDICKTSAARGKASHRGTTLAPPHSKSSSSKAATSSQSSTAITTLSHSTSVLSSTSNVPSLSTDRSPTSSGDSPTLLTVAAPHGGDTPVLVPLEGVSSNAAHLLAPALSSPSTTAVNTLSNPQSKKAATSTSSGKRRRSALDDGEEARSATVRSSFGSADISPPSKSTNATSMITLAGAVASLGTSINHQTMSSDTHIANKVQGFINAQDYLSDLEKSLIGEYYAVQPTLASGLLSMTPAIAKITLHRRAKALAKDVEEEMEDMTVRD